jgi:acetyl-CoA C-acetyltransferase/acetyl-CoA acyltransferase
MTKFGISEKTNVEMFAEAAMEAINESQITPGDIEALFLGNVFGGLEEGQKNMGPFVVAELGMPNIPASRYEGACASATLAIINAVYQVAGGIYDVVLAGGTEKAAAMGTAFATRAFQMASDMRFEGPSGITFPSVFGMMTHLYAHKYGIPLDILKKQMAMVAVKNHENGFLNPKAHFKKIIDTDDVLKSIMICDPLQLYDCCPFSDGAAAVVLTTPEIAGKWPQIPKPIRIAGTGSATAGSLGDQKDITRVRSREISARMAYKQANLTPDDVDLCELHDCFTIAEIIATEGLGFFEFGQGGEAVQRGDTKKGGKVVVNPSGGLKSKGHPIGATGAAQVYEIVKQLRGECGPRQVEGAQVGMVDTLGGDLGLVCNILLRGE